MTDQRAEDSDRKHRCLSCRTQRREVEMVGALSPDWTPIANGWQCRDREACYQAMQAGVFHETLSGRVIWP